MGLGKEYQQIQMGGAHGILPQSRDRMVGAPAGGTAGICRQHGSIGNQAVCQAPPTVSANSFALGGTASRTYTARRLAVACFT